MLVRDLRQLCIQYRHRSRLCVHKDNILDQIIQIKAFLTGISTEATNVQKVGTGVGNWLKSFFSVLFVLISVWQFGSEV